MNFQRSAVFAFAATLGINGVLAAEPPTPEVVVYLGATLFDGTLAPAQANMAIVTRAEHIVAVLPAKAFQAPKDAEIVDVHGKFIIPGLINSHVHLATSADQGIAKAYLRRELYSGVTAVRDMAGDVRLLSELKREAEFHEIPSPDIYYAALMAGPEFFKDPRTHDAARGRVAGEVPWMRAVTPQTNLQIAVAEAHGTGATGIKVYADLSAPLVDAITAEAHRQNMLVWSHATVFPARPRDITDAGVDVMSHACFLGYQVSGAIPSAMVYPLPMVDAEKFARPNADMSALYEDMKSRGTILDATLYVNFKNDPFGCTFLLTAQITNEAYLAGVQIAAGTDDDPDWQDKYSALDVELGLMVKRAGMTPADAIRSATLIGARTIGRDKDMGTIEVGKLANLIVLDKDPLKDISGIRSVYLTVKNGIRYPHSKYTPVTGDQVKRD
jgi:imidazolonepropionase-like amidohydrolase